MRSNRYGLTALLFVFSASAWAAPITFNFSFADGGTATATGSITFEETLISNPGFQFIDLPDPAVLDLSVTVAGSAGGDGTFNINNFTGVIFDTGSMGLDFSVELVGQPTGSGPWGTPGPVRYSSKGDNGGGTGDFNLFIGRNKGAAPPNGVAPFTLGANGGAGEGMVIVSMAALPPASGVPTLSTWGLIGLMGLMLLVAGHRLRARTDR